MNRRGLASPVATTILVFGLISAAAGKPATKHRSSGRNALRNAKAIAEVLRVDQERANALVNNDTDALDRIIADDCTYVHPNGKLETKAEMLAGLKARDRTYVSIDREDVKVRIFKNMAVVTGRNSLKAKYQGKDYNVQNRFLRVYQNRDGRWQMVAHQATPVASREARP